MITTRHVARIDALLGLPGAIWAGVWLARKARTQAAASGVQTAARNLRKQGAPLHVALAILARGVR